MTSYFQNYILKNSKILQNLVNNKLANSGPGKKFWRWMEIGNRGNGKHYFGRYLKAINSIYLVVGQRFNWHRPHLGKYLFTKEREIFLTGYSILLFFMFIFNKRNSISPLYTENDPYLHDYDNPNYFAKKYGVIVPGYVSNYRVSAHFLEINKIFQREMLRNYEDFSSEVHNEFKESPEKIKRTKFATNPNYVYEPFGWETS